jgi:hypothetical protein
MVFIAVSALGVEAGWQPLPGGGHAYTIQIEPSLLGQLQQGNDLVSEVPAHIHVRQLRVTLGTGALARIDETSDSIEPRGTEPRRPELDNALAAPGPDTPTTQPAAGEPPTTADAAAAAPSPAVPAKFDAPDAAAQPLTDAAAASQPQPHSTERPQLDAGAAVPGAGGQAERPPWWPFLVAVGLLACSLAANLYLGWVARDARTRYREAVSKLRPATSG